MERPMKARSKIYSEIDALKRRIRVLEKFVGKAPAGEFMPMSDDLYKTIADFSAEILDWNNCLRECTPAAGFRAANNCDAPDSNMTDPRANR